MGRVSPLMLPWLAFVFLSGELTMRGIAYAIVTATRSLRRRTAMP